MRARTLLLSLLASALIMAPSVAFAQTPIVLEATIPETTPRHFSVPFTVPEGVREIEVRHDDLSAANILDWGLRDPSRFRGWGGGNTEPAIVSERAASRSYVPGAIPAGQWSVMIGLAKVLKRPARYRIEIILRSTPTLAEQPERRPYAATAALNPGARWYAGDFHVHSRESGDRPAIQFWESLASRGLHVAPIGGSDDHSARAAMGMLGSLIGGPTTMVFARELSVAAFIEDVRAGRTVVKLQGHDDPMVDLRADSLMVGDASAIAARRCAPRSPAGSVRRCAFCATAALRTRCRSRRIRSRRRSRSSQRAPRSTTVGAATSSSLRSRGS